MNTQDTTTPASVRSAAPAGALIVVNALLLALLVVVTLGGRTSAALRDSEQPGSTPPRVRGDYTMLAPESPAGNTGALVILDSVNQQMAVLEWDKTRRTFDVKGFRDLSADVNENIGR